MIEEADYPRLEEIYRGHEGVAVPAGHFDAFRETIRGELYFVAEADGKVIGGGGIADYVPGEHACLVFGVVERAECRKGFGTSILLARLLFIDPGSGGSVISLLATEWTVEFFARLGFGWIGETQDDAGNRLFEGRHVLLPRHRPVLRRILDTAEVTFDSDIEEYVGRRW